MTLNKTLILIALGLILTAVPSCGNRVMPLTGRVSCGMPDGSEVMGVGERSEISLDADKRLLTLTFTDGSKLFHFMLPGETCMITVPEQQAVTIKDNNNNDVSIKLSGNLSSRVRYRLRPFGNHP